MMTDREGEYSEGYPYPMLSKVVESVIENMQIEARLQQNEQAIADMEAVIDPGLPATLNRIEGALRGQDIRIDYIESINIRSALLDIEAALDPELPATLNRIDGTLVDQNNRLNYLEAIDFVEMDILQSQTQSIYTNIGKFYYNKGYCDKYFARNDALDVRLLSYMRTDELDSILSGYLSLKLDKAEFDDFLAGEMTQETTDRIAFSLADVDVNGVRMNLGTALEDRPSFNQVPGIEFNAPYRKDRGLPPLSLTDWVNKIQDNEQFKIEKGTSIGLPSAWYPSLGTMPLYSGDPTILSWIRMIAENDKRLNELPEIPDLPDIGGMKTCFTDGGNVLENLTKSMETQIAEVEGRFDSMKTQMFDVNNEFIALMGEIQEWIEATDPGISMGTFVTGLLELFAEFRNTFSRISGDFNQTATDFAESRTAFSDIRAKVTALKSCGISNMNWNPS